MLYSKSLDYADLHTPEVRSTARDLKRWIVRWCVGGNRIGVNGHVKRRLRIRPHKLWEYARGLALTGASRHRRGDGGPFRVLDVGGGMTIPLFYLAQLGDTVVSLDIGEELVKETNRIAERKRLSIDARTTNLVETDLDGSFDRVYSFCVIEHIHPPGQLVVARKMGELLEPGGQMALTFDYGENANSEAPMHHLKDVRELVDAVGLPLMGDGEFHDTCVRYPLSRRYPERPFTFGSLFFEKPR